MVTAQEGYVKGGGSVRTPLLNGRRKRQKGDDTNVDELRASREGMEIRRGVSCFVLGRI